MGRVTGFLLEICLFILLCLCQIKEETFQILYCLLWNPRFFLHSLTILRRVVRDLITVSLKHITTRMVSYCCHYKPFRLLFLLQYIFPNRILARSQQAFSNSYFLKYFSSVFWKLFRGLVWWHDATLFYLFFFRTADNFPANKYRKRNDHWEKPLIDWA